MCHSNIKWAAFFVSILVFVLKWNLKLNLLLHLINHAYESVENELMSTWHLVIIETGAIVSINCIACFCFFVCLFC